MGVNELTEYLKTAFELKNNGDYKQAIDYFYKALAIDSESTEIMDELAFLYSKLCRYDRSISFYEQILAKETDNSEIKLKLAHVLKINKDYKRAEQLLLELYDSGINVDNTAEELFYILMYNHKYGKIITSYNKYAKTLKNSGVLYFVALAHAELGNKNTAEEFFKKSYNNDEKNILSGVEIAKRFLEKGQNDEAQNLAERLLKYTEDARVYYILGEIEYAKGNIDSAIKNYSYAIKINPQKAEYYYKLALTFSLKGFFKEAEESFCNAINIDNTNETYNYALAYMYYITGKYDLAEHIVDFLLSQDSDNMQAISLKLLILTENNKNQFAGKLIERLEAFENKDDFSLYAQAMYYSKLNMWEKATDSIIEALRLNRTSAEYNYQLSRFYYEQGKIDEAETICEKIISENEKYIQAYILLSKIKYRNKNFTIAQELIDKVKEMDKNIGEVYYIEALILFEQKNYEKAIEQYKTALSLYPDKEEYYAKIGECYFCMKNYEESYLYYKEAAEFNITKAEYRFYMAKCCEMLDDKENAITNYSMVKRLAPLNIKYMKEYANFLKDIGKKKEAVKLLKNLRKQLRNEAEEELTRLIKTFK